MGTVLKWLGRMVLGLVVVMLGLGLVAYWRMTASLPWTEGERSAAGLSAPVELLRGAHAIPHISGESDEDVFFGLGYAHAQDRFWQMDLNRRFVSGRLSELVGEVALSSDMLMRALDLGGHAERSLASLPADARAWLEAYTRGVNAVLDDPDFVAPPEYVVLLASPERWRPEDSLAALKAMAFNLGGNAWDEFARAYYIDKLGPEKGPQFTDPPHPPFFVSLSPEDLGLSADDTAAESEGAPDGLTNASGAPADQSNNWVVDGSRTVSGSPILANDPHLAASQPGIWYMAHLAFPDRNVVGVSIPGIPAIILGRNDVSAWGMTNTGPDVQDLYVVTRSPHDPSLYLGPDGPEAFITREDEITVRFAGTRTAEFLATRHGPVLPKGHTIMTDLAAEDQEVAMAFATLSGQDHSLAGLMYMMRNDSWAGFSDIGRYFTGPMQSVVYAHRDGDIGLLLPGSVPVRSPDHDSAGRLPVDGGLAQNDWQGFIPTAELPKVLNPRSGMIVTANNKIVPDEYPHSLTQDWVATERARRIADLLDRERRHDLDSMAAIQLDTVGLRTRQLLPLLTAVPAPDGRAREARALLADWDGDFAADRAEPLLYAAWIAELGRLIYADDLGEDFRRAWRLNETFLLSVVDGTHAAWCDVIDTPDTEETCEPLIARALENAVETLTDAYGRDMSAWRWGEPHGAHFDHQPFDVFPLLGDLFSRRAPHGGSQDTVNVGAFAVRNTPDFSTVWIPSFRALYDLSALEDSRLIIPTGQSGHLLSPHYDDLSSLWSEGAYLTVRTDLDAVRPTAQRLVLTPTAE